MGGERRTGGEGRGGHAPTQNTHTHIQHTYTVYNHNPHPPLPPFVICTYLAPPDLVDEEPGDHGGGRRAVGVEEGLHGQAVRAQRRARVEAEPAEPEQAWVVWVGGLGGWGCRGLVGGGFVYTWHAHVHTCPPPPRHSRRQSKPNKNIKAAGQGARTGAEDDEGDVRRVVLYLVGAGPHVEDERAGQRRVPRGGLHGYRDRWGLWVYGKGEGKRVGCVGMESQCGWSIHPSRVGGH